MRPGRLRAAQCCVCVLLLAWVAGCAGGAQSTPAPTEAAARPATGTATAAAPTAPAPGSAATSGATLHILSRGDQIDPDIYDAFTQQTGITVEESSYQVDDELVDMLQRGEGADLILASDQALPRLNAQGRLARLDAAKLPNLKQVDPRLKALPFDPANTLSVPVLWGTVGILYRTDRGLRPLDSWQSALDEARRNPANTIALLDEPRTGVGAALKALGLSLNSRSSAELQRASAWLTARRGLIKLFDSAAWSDALITGDIAIAQAYSNDAAFTQASNANLHFAIPREGAALWLDSFAIPAAGKHAAEAATFVDFALRPEQAARLAAYAYSLPSVPEAYNRMDAARAALLRSGYIPDDETFKRLELVADVGASLTEYERIWLQVTK